jgi:hypothetical protein
MDVKNKKTVEDIIVFKGSLDELNSVSEVKYEVHPDLDYRFRVIGDLPFLVAKKNIFEKGYDGIIRREWKAINSTYFNYIEGVPIMKCA